MTLAIATILTAYISALTLSNQAFAQPGQISTISGQAGSIHTMGGGFPLGQSSSNSPRGWIVDTGVYQAALRYAIVSFLKSLRWLRIGCI
jgi:hypothetical protein